MYIYDKNRIPFFSIVLCTFNRGYILEKAIRSVINQIEKDWELIVVDDGSSDDTFDICKKFINSHNNIRYLYQNNTGVAFARNAGIFASAGLYVTFLDSDDEYKPDHLSIRKHILLQNPQVDFLYGGIEIIGDEYVPDRMDPQVRIHLDNCYVGGTFCIKRDVLLELGGFLSMGYGEDADLAERALESDLFLASIDYPTYIYNRTLPDSICNKFNL